VLGLAESEELDVPLDSLPSALVRRHVFIITRSAC
jgi:hypothetical protein